MFVICLFTEMFGELRFGSGARAGEILQIPVGATTIIGRDPDKADLAISDRSLSRTHFAIKLNESDKTAMVKDLKSANGTIVDEIKLKPKEWTPLANGGIIVAGRCRLSFQFKKHPLKKSAESSVILGFSDIEMGIPGTSSFTSSMHEHLRTFREKMLPLIHQASSSQRTTEGDKSKKSSREISYSTTPKQHRPASNIIIKKCPEGHNSIPMLCASSAISEITSLSAKTREKQQVAMDMSVKVFLQSVVDVDGVLFSACEGHGPSNATWSFDFMSQFAVQKSYRTKVRYVGIFLDKQGCKDMGILQTPQLFPTSGVPGEFASVGVGGAFGFGQGILPETPGFGDLSRERLLGDVAFPPDILFNTNDIIRLGYIPPRGDKPALSFFMSLTILRHLLDKRLIYVSGANPSVEGNDHRGWMSDSTLEGLPKVRLVGFHCVAVVLASEKKISEGVVVAFRKAQSPAIPIFRFGSVDIVGLTGVARQFIIAVWNRLMNAEQEKQKKIAQDICVFLPKVIADELMNGSLAKRLGGQKIESSSILFADIVGFTRLSESLQPENIISLVNAWFQALLPAVISEVGVVDKLLGDCIMALWGVPFPTLESAASAIRSGLQLQNRAFEFSVEHPGTPMLRLGVGINTGSVVAGNVGCSESRLDYTVIGDTVNTASRIESNAPSGMVLVSATTLWLGGMQLELRKKKKGKIAYRKNYLASVAKEKERMEKERLELERLERDSIAGGSTAGSAGPGASGVGYDNPGTSSHQSPGVISETITHSTPGSSSGTNSETTTICVRHSKKDTNSLMMLSDFKKATSIYEAHHLQIPTTANVDKLGKKSVILIALFTRRHGVSLAENESGSRIRGPDFYTDLYAGWVFSDGCSWAAQGLPSDCCIVKSGKRTFVVFPFMEGSSVYSDHYSEFASILESVREKVDDESNDTSCRGDGAPFPLSESEESGTMGLLSGHYSPDSTTSVRRPASALGLSSTSCGGAGGCGSSVSAGSKGGFAGNMRDMTIERTDYLKRLSPSSMIIPSREECAKIPPPPLAVVKRVTSSNVTHFPTCHIPDSVLQWAVTRTNFIFSNADTFQKEGKLLCDALRTLSPRHGCSEDESAISEESELFLSESFKGKIKWIFDHCTLPQGVGVSSGSLISAIKMPPLFLKGKKKGFESFSIRAIRDRESNNMVLSIPAMCGDNPVLLIMKLANGAFVVLSPLKHNMLSMSSLDISIPEMGGGVIRVSVRYALEGTDALKEAHVSRDVMNLLDHSRLSVKNMKTLFQTIDNLKHYFTIFKKPEMGTIPRYQEELTRKGVYRWRDTRSEKGRVEVPVLEESVPSYRSTVFLSDPTLGGLLPDLGEVRSVSFTTATWQDMKRG
ncbi:hypothetical protein ADUPG1_013305 [Aduncisulcus paluster]|nr:hypothetical protein ADUPG1_013305 [Aduncisulcus paluster]